MHFGSGTIWGKANHRENSLKHPKETALLLDDQGMPSMAR